MKRACKRRDLKLTDSEFSQLTARLYEKRWIIDVRDPVKKPEHVLEYRYPVEVSVFPPMW